MGRGAAMRAAASRVPGVGVVGPGALRGKAPALAPVDQAVRKSPVLVSASLSSRDAVDVAPVQRPAWELDSGDLVMAAGEPVPRVVFAGVPSFDEAKEATAELKDALDKVYPSLPKFSESGELATCDQLLGLSLTSKSDSETKSCLVFGRTKTLSAPNYAEQAFRYLHTSTKAQHAFASVVSDPNVWNAVVQNSEVQEFMKSNQKIAVFEVPDKSEDSSDCRKAKASENWFTDMLKNIKLNVVDFASSLSGKLQNIFGFSTDANEDAKASDTDGTIGMGASILGLVIMVVMVVLLKRV